MTICLKRQQQQKQTNGTESSLTSKTSDGTGFAATPHFYLGDAE